jgi:predicted dehydrogenase
MTRYAIVGCGAGVARHHLEALSLTPNAQIVGMCDLDPARGAGRAQAHNSPFFTNHRVMLRETHPDVAVICAPHPFHAALALDCFAAGAHVLSEKPMAVQVREADEMIAAAEQAGRLLIVNFQNRFRPVVERAYEFAAQGGLGALVRVLCIDPTYRTAAYFQAAGWRATWRGEGGGVLMNQAPHTLDLMCHLAGEPASVLGRTRTRRHLVECEDTAEAMLEYPNGATGYFYASTIEWGVAPRMQVVGECGALELVGNQLTKYRFSEPLPEYMVNSLELYRGPDMTLETVELEDTSGGHLAIYRDLEEALANGRQPRANGQEGRMSLELANAIIFSSFTKSQVVLPLDRDAYALLLEDLKAGRR